MASRGKTTQLSHMFVADFETTDTDRVYTTDTQTGEPIYYQRVWLAGYKNLESMQSTYFTSLRDFMDDILSRKDNSNREYAFHNLKFDGSFLLPYLFEKGYTVTTDKPQPKQFNVLVDDRNNWYSVVIQITKRLKITLWDMLKLFPSKLEYLPDIYHTPTRKIHEDQGFYTKHRPLDYEPDEQDYQYFENDLQVPAEVLNAHIDMFGLRFKKTQAGQSFYNFEQTFKAWKWRFPPLSNRIDELIKPAYWGGIAYTPHHVVGKNYYDIGVFDINSSYPDKLANCKLPYGECVLEKGENEHPDMSKFWIAEALVEFKLKENHLPCIPSKAISENRPLDVDKWVDDSEDIVRITFSNIDYMTIQQSYDIKVWRWKWSLHWAWKKQKEISRFVHYNNDQKVKYSRLAKETDDPTLKAEYEVVKNRAKIDNNSFYGKFGEDVIKYGKTPYYEDEEITWVTDREDEQGERARKFRPVAIAITAWGRKQLVEMANILGEHFLYCDTDSIHYQLDGHDKIEQAEKDGIFEIDPVKLGAWKLEGYMRKGRYLRAKCYMEETYEGELEATVAGLPPDPHTGNFSKKRSCLNWDNFYIGTVIPPEKSNKLRTVRTPTGNKLVPVGYQIKKKATLFD